MDYCTCLATLALLFLSLPVFSNSRTVPIGASLAVAVAMVTPSHNAHNDDSASPLKPNVRTVERSSNVASFEVWCFNAT